MVQSFSQSVVHADILSKSDIPLVLTAYLFWKFLKRTKIVSLSDIPLGAALDEVERDPETPEPIVGRWRKVLTILWD